MVMKKIFILITISLLLLSCCPETLKVYYNKNIIACGVKEPQKNFPWLAEIIKKSENDKTGNYLGTIWLEKYKGEDVFVTNMMLGSGGVAYWFFDCSGNNIAPKGKDADFDLFVTNMQLNIIVYSNLPF
jgi:hypothetical protein